MDKPALYFPYVHIRDDEWLKAAALYWPSVRRLVPHGYAKHDSATAQVFVDCPFSIYLRSSHSFCSAGAVFSTFLFVPDSFNSALAVTAQ
jgi:hypothetical protein